MIDRLDDVLDDLRQGVRIPEVSKGWALDIDVEQPSDGMVAFILEHADRSRNRAEGVPIGFRLDGAVNRERNVRLLLATNYLICLAMLVFVVVILLVGDRYPRVDGSEWRVKPTRSGKTWILYRWEGWNEMRINKRFKTRQQAEEFARSVLLSVQSKAFSAPVSERLTEKEGG